MLPKSNQTPDTPNPWQRCEVLAAERDKLGDRIQAGIESLTADFATLTQLSDDLKVAAPVPVFDVFSWALSPLALMSALERAFAKAGHPSARYSASQHGDLSTFSKFVRDGSIAVTQRKAT